MDAGRDKQIEELFQQALDLSPPQRDRFLSEACRGDANRQMEIEALLRHAEAAPTRFLAGAPREANDEPVEPILDGMVGRRVGRYKLLCVIASGGMGTVYEAEQEQPNRRVAVKLIRQGFASGGNVRRFLNESEVLGRLSHPGIAQIFEAAIHREPTGVLPYFAMEYLPQAVPITEYASARSLSLRERLELFGAACNAIQYAHQHAVIHRDIKPANVLVMPDGRVKIIDFGVARVLDADAGVSNPTVTGQLVGTLRYMSPEQCASGIMHLDTTTDVYSLGVVLYELLTGAMPYDTGSQSPFEIPRIIRETEPIKPSAVAPSLRGDLECILLKALEKDRQRRYQSVAQLADDISRFLRGEPVSARRSSYWYVWRKGLRRHWAATAVISTFVLLCAVSALWLATLYSRADTQRQVAQQALALADMRGYLNSIALAHAAVDAGQTKRVLEYLDECPTELRGWEWYYLRRLTDLSRASFPDFSRDSNCVYAPDGATLATWSTEGPIRLLDARSGKVLQELAGHEGPVRCVAYARHGQTLVSGGDDRTIFLWDLRTGTREAIENAHQGRVAFVAASPRDDLIASSGLDGTVRLWSLDDLSLRNELVAGTPPLALSFSPTSDELAVGDADGLITFWNTDTGEAVRRITSDARSFSQLAFNDDGRLLAAGSSDNAVRVWDVATGALLHLFDCQADTPLGVAISPNGQYVAAAAGAIHVWEVGSGREVAERLGHVGGATTVAFTPDGTSMASGGYDGHIRLWDVPPREEPMVLRGHTDFVRCAAVFSDGRRMASIGRDGTIRIWDVERGEQVDELASGFRGDQTLALSPDGTVAVSGGLDGILRVHDLATHATRRPIDTHQGGILTVAISPDGHEVASAGTDGRCRFWDPRTGVSLGEIRSGKLGLRHVVYSPDGSLFATSGYDRTGRVWERRTLRQRFAITEQDDSVGQAAFSPDSRRVAFAGNDGTVRICEVQTGRVLQILQAHRSAAQSVAFLPDGSRLISGGYDHVINVWDPTTGALALTLRGHRGGIPWLAVSPDGTWFASASNDATIRVWRAKPRS